MIEMRIVESEGCRPEFQLDVYQTIRCFEEYWTMIEMRIVESEGCRPEFQYRYKLPETEQWVGADWKLVEMVS